MRLHIKRLLLYSLYGLLLLFSAILLYTKISIKQTSTNHQVDLSASVEENEYYYGNHDKQKDAPKFALKNVYRDLPKAAARLQAINPDVKNNDARVYFNKQGDLTCSGLTRQHAINTSDGHNFIPLDHNPTNIYGFAAYFDDVKQVIRITAIRNLHSELTIRYCQLWSESTAQVTIVDADIVTVGAQGRGHRYDGVFFVCKPGDPSIVYTAVSLTSAPCDQSNNMFTIHYPDSTKPKYKFNVCLGAPLNLDYDKSNELIEWIEVNQLLGADHFTIYNYSSSQRIRNILDIYQKEGLVTIVQWPVPVKVHIWPRPNGYTEDIHYFGQLSALNDCLYRTRHTAQYIVFVDLDEFIVPRKTPDWQSLLDLVDKYHKHHVYVFANAFFRKEWVYNNNSVEPIVKNLELSTLLHQQREWKIWPHTQRSKIIIESSHVEQVDIHFATQYTGRDLDVDPEYGLLHHYRNWENYKDKPGALDQTILKYKNAIIKKVNARHKQFNLFNNDTV